MSRNDDKEAATTLEHEQALKVYIDALLLEPALQEAPAEAEVEAPVVTPMADEPETQAVETPAAEPAAQSEPVPHPPATMRYEPFDCLLFKVAGSLPLAVPLVSLSGIMKWPDEITPIPGYAEWFLGLLPSRGRQVKVIDLARFVISENHKSRGVLAGERQFKHLLLLEGGRMGVACDELGTVLKVAPDQVRWRSDTGVRPWLAGTLIEQMSALLDVEQLAAILKEGTRLDDIT